VQVQVQVQVQARVQVQEMRWQAQDVQTREQQTRMLMQAAGRARHRGVRSTLHWVASLKQHTTDHK
jgi:hypothetical protein